MRFRGLDLNLLATLDRLLAERNVSRAADKLCLRRSATSGVLARLREYFDDELVVQIGRKMTLTARAEELADGPPNYESAIADLCGNRREMDVILANFATVPIMIAGTDRAAIVHLRLAEIFCNIMPLRMFDAPMKLPPLRIGMQWHQLCDSDQLPQYVRRRLLAMRDEIAA